jgi:hypothetical protein
LSGDFAKWLAAVVGLARMHKLLTVAAGLAALACVAGCESGLPVEATEKTLVLRAGDLVAYGYGLEETEQFEKFSKTKYFDGSREITYEFETPETEEDNPLYMNVTMTFEKKTSDALLSHGAEKTGAAAGLRIAGVKSREIENFYDYGDSSAFYVLEMEGRPVGNMFSVRDGKKIYMIIMTGMYFDDAAVWKELVEEKLKKFSGYEPG